MYGLYNIPTCPKVLWCLDMTQIITRDHVIYTCIYIFAIRSRLREILSLISQLALLFIIDKTQAWTIYTINAIMALFMYSTFCRYTIFPVLEYFGTLVLLSSRNHWQVTHLLTSIATVTNQIHFRQIVLS